MCFVILKEAHGALNIPVIFKQYHVIPNLHDDTELELVSLGWPQGGPVWSIFHCDS